MGELSQATKWAPSSKVHEGAHFLLLVFYFMANSTGPGPSKSVNSLDICHSFTSIWWYFYEEKYFKKAVKNILEC